MIHTIFFDVGGTLVTGKSTLLSIAEAMDKARSGEIFKFLIDHFMDIYLDENPPRFFSIKEILALTTRLAAAEFGVEDISHRTLEFYRNQHLRHDYLYEDTRPVLDKLRGEKIKMILVSDADSDVLTEQLTMFDMIKYFDSMIISDQTQAYKPSDKVVARANAFCREPLSQILFVGDRIVDIKTAQKMNIKSALIDRNGEFKYEADYKIKSLYEILDIIKE